MYLLMKWMGGLLCQFQWALQTLIFQCPFVGHLEVFVLQGNVT